MLKLSSALAVCVLPQTRVLMRKLIFLKHVVSGGDVSSHAFRTQAAGDVNRIHLVQECRYLEEDLATSSTSTILQQASEVDARELKRTINAKDCIPPDQQDGCRSGRSHKLKIWDVTLDKGPRVTKSMLALLFEITKPAFGS